MKPSPEEYLAAHADGGLSELEERRVEQLLADDPDSRAELAAMKDTIRAVRGAAVPAVPAPDWQQMARNISAACDTPRSVFASIRDSISRARLAATLSGLAVVAALAVAIIGSNGDPTRDLSIAVGVVNGGAGLATAAELSADYRPDSDEDNWDGDELDELGLSLDVFDEPDYELWLEGLSDEELDELDNWLAEETKAG